VDILNQNAPNSYGVMALPGPNWGALALPQIP